MPKILIVDDEPHILRITSMRLKRHGYDLLEATNGAEALSLLEQSEVDLIISDMNMPVMNGLELVKSVRNDRESDVPFLLLTARCDQAKFADELDRYNVRLYPKPFIPSRLVADVQCALETAEAGDRSK